MNVKSLRTLETPPPELAARVMGDVRRWNAPPDVGWIITGQTVLLAALLLVSSATLPQSLTATASNIHDWSDALVQATLEVSDKVGQIFLGEEEGGIL